MGVRVQLSTHLSARVVYTTDTPTSLYYMDTPTSLYDRGAYISLYTTQCTHILHTSSTQGGV